MSEPQYPVFTYARSYSPGDVVSIQFGKGYVNRVMDGAGGWSDGESLPKLNIDLLEQLVLWAKKSSQGDVSDLSGAFKELYWDQGTWGRLPHSYEETHHPCGTACCLAGSAAISAGIATMSSGGGLQIESQEITSYNGEQVSLGTDDFHTAGAAILGLTFGEAVELFRATNGLSAIRRHIRNFAKARGEYTTV